MIKREDIVAKAREYIGTPYEHQKRIKGIAIDCAGVPVGVAVELGLVIEDYTSYAREPNPPLMRSYLDRNLVRVNKSDMQIGDVAWIKYTKSPQHLAIIGNHPNGGFTLIHADSLLLSKVIEHSLDKTWLDRIVAVWRYREIE